MQMDQLLPQFQHHVNQIHFDFYDAMASIEPSQCVICIRTPMLAGAFKNIKYQFCYCIQLHSAHVLGDKIAA